MCMKLVTLMINTRCSRCGVQGVPLIKYSKRTNEYLGITRIYCMCRKCNTERMAKYYKTERGRKIVQQNVYKSTKKHQHKQNARARVMYALIHGKIKRPEKCPLCGKEAVCQAHHEDYNKPLEVRWMCRQCHADVERKLKLSTELV